MYIIISNKIFNKSYKSYAYPTIIISKNNLLYKRIKLIILNILFLSQIVSLSRI